MGELRLYAVGIEEVRGMFGASPQVAEHLREVARRAFAPPAVEARSGLLSKLGPIFKRVPATPVISPTQPSRTMSRCCWPGLTYHPIGPELPGGYSKPSYRHRLGLDTDEPDHAVA